jgi:hypothetical protein
MSISYREIAKTDTEVPGVPAALPTAVQQHVPKLAQRHMTSITILVSCQYLKYTYR